MKKRLKLFSILLACFMALAFVSCEDSITVASGDGGGTQQGGSGGGTGGGASGGGTGGGTQQGGLDSITGLANQLAWLRINARNGGSYVLEINLDESISPQTLSFNGRNNITITLRGVGASRTISLSYNGQMFWVQSGVTLILDNNITLQGRNNNTHSLVHVTGGSFRMNTGSRITGNRNDSSGGGVFMDSGVITIDGGNISGNTSGAGGGVAILNEGTLIMNSGTISGNTADSGGGVFQSGGTFTMSGGTMSNNTAFLGGGVNVSTGGIFTMDSGTISGNTAGANGGGVLILLDGTFALQGGSIIGNTADPEDAFSKGGGVALQQGGTFTMNGGSITGNTAGGFGGGFSIQIQGDSESPSVFTKTGGSINGYIAGDSSSNTAIRGIGSNDRGHAVYVESDIWQRANNKRRETTAGPGVNLDSRIPGVAGGWEN